MTEPCADCPPPVEQGSLRVERWRIWYDDGSVHDGRTLHDWMVLPDDGVLGFVLFYERLAPNGEHMRRIASGNDYYWAFPGLLDTVYAHGNEDPHERYPGASVKRGRWTDDISIDTVNQAMAEAC